MGFYFGTLAVIVVLSFVVNEKNKKTLNVYIDKIHFYYFLVCFLVTSCIFICQKLIYGYEELIIGFLFFSSLFFAVCFALYVSAKKTDQVNPTSDNLSDMPDICPHCKNPNTRKTRLCEWCGSQIV